MMNQYVPNQSVSLRPSYQVHSALSAHALSRMPLFIAFLPCAVGFELLVRCLHSTGGIIGMSAEGKELTVIAVEFTQHRQQETCLVYRCPSEGKSRVLQYSNRRNTAYSDDNPAALRAYFNGTRGLPYVRR